MMMRGISAGAKRRLVGGALLAESTFVMAFSLPPPPCSLVPLLTALF